MANGYAYNPTLETVLMIEETAKKHSGEVGKYQLWKKLPKKVMYQTYQVALDYLLESKKIMIDRQGKISWIWNPELVAKYLQRPDLRIGEDKETMKEITEVLRRELPYLRKAYGVRKIAVFGSHATGKAKKGSDLDLLIEFDKAPGLGFLDLINHLEKKTGKKVDILTSEGLDSIKIKEVARDIKEALIYV